MKKKNQITGNIILVSVFALIVLYACNDTYQLEPVVATYLVADSNITSTTAKLTGQIQILGTQNISEYGMEIYKTSITNMIAYKAFTDPATVDTFTVVFTGLEPNTRYYYWAYAMVNTTRVHSQNVPSFTTKAAR
jgi:hypothetical protein